MTSLEHWVAINNNVTEKWKQDNKNVHVPGIMDKWTEKSQKPS